MVTVETGSRFRYKNFSVAEWGTHFDACEGEGAKAVKSDSVASTLLALPLAI